MSGAPRQVPATYAELEALPDTVVGEIVAGELHASPRPAFGHGSSALEIAGDLVGPFRRGRGGPGGWILLPEPELHLGPDVMVPDIAGWRRERLPGALELKWSDIPPDWICEIVSPSTARLDRALKLPRYAASGVRHLWLVDPLARTVEVYRLTPDGWLLVVTHAGDAIVRIEPFDAIELDLLAWWGEDRPPGP